MAKKNNTAEKALLDAEKISKALKESTEKTLKSIVNEAISDFIKDDDEPKNDDIEKEEQPIDDDSFEVEDVKTEEEPSDDADEETPAEDADEEGAAAPEEGDADDEWADMEDFKVGDNDYDFTGVDGETALKVYNKLGDDDQIFIKKEDDGTYTMEDEETGAEYVIELGDDGEDVDADAVDADEEPAGDDEPEGDEETSFEFDIDDEEPEGDEEESFEVDLDNDEPKDDDEQLNEDLGYTDNYQDKDPIDGLKMNEPADSKTTNDWDEGAPEGTEKPWAGKGDGEPFEKNVNECGMMPETEIEEATNVGGATQEHSMSKTNQPKNRKENGPKVKHNVSAAGEFSPEVNESIKKIISKAKEIQAENKKYGQAIASIKKALREAAILNVNYGKLVSLLVNETTTKQEKLSIVERFNSVKTVNEGTQLYETIKRELNETKQTAPIVERTINAESSKKINETTIYSQNASINLMERMDNLFKKSNKTNISEHKESASLSLMERMDNLGKRY